jgi:integrase
VGEFLRRWLREVVAPNLAPLTHATYETMVRLYIDPGIGHIRIDRLAVHDVQDWLNRLATTCQCCAQGKDARRAAKDPTRARRCAKGQCCHTVASPRTIKDVRTVLRSALSTAMAEELIERNVAALVKAPKLRQRKVTAWSSEEARRFLESARAAGDSLYAAFVLMLVLGLRKGEVLGLTWPTVDLDTAALTVDLQLQRVRRELLLRQTKTAASDDDLPLPAICVTALQLRAERQDEDRADVGEAWRGADTGDGLVFTGRYGTPIDPRTLNRRFTARCEAAGVRHMRVHDARKTCATLLVDLDVHPRVIMRVLRHADISVSMEIYAKASSDATRDALRKLGEILA